MIIIILIVLLLSFGLVVFFGAPYLPTLKPQIAAALDLAKVQPGQMLLELGCGDGSMVVAAAEKGMKVVGYELNPFLALLSWLRTRKYGPQVQIVWGNYWKQQLPQHADVIFVFLLDKYMKKLDKKITQTYQQKSVKLVSFTFKVPGKKITNQSRGVFLYKY